jgi:hypothetical protein
VLQSHRNCHRHPIFPATRTKNLSTEKQTPNDAIAGATSNVLLLKTTLRSSSSSLRTQTPEQSKNSFPGKNTRKKQEEEEEPNETAQRGGEVQPADQHRSQIVVLWKPREIESADDSHEREDRRLDRNPSMT